MEWVTDQHEGRRGQALGHGHGTHSSPHRTTTQGYLAGPDAESCRQFSGRRAYRLDTEFRRVRPALPGGLPRKLDALDHEARIGDRLIDGE
jgi:hypothetical protein